MDYLHTSEIIDGHQMVVMINKEVQSDNGIAIWKIIDEEQPQNDELMFHLSWKEVLEACLQWRMEREKANEAK
jgi:hypothetical protein